MCHLSWLQNGLRGSVAVHDLQSNSVSRDTPLPQYLEFCKGSSYGDPNNAGSAIHSHTLKIFSREAHFPLPLFSSSVVLINAAFLCYKQTLAQARRQTYGHLFAYEKFGVIFKPPQSLLREVTGLPVTAWRDSRLQLASEKQGVLSSCISWIPSG